MAKSPTPASRDSEMQKSPRKIKEFQLSYKNFLNINNGFFGIVLLLIGHVTSYGDYGTQVVNFGKPNAFGLYGMSGNVWEWTDSWYDKTLGDKDVSVEDKWLRVLRGGSWTDPPANLRSSNRQAVQPIMRDSKYGFRCALPKTESTPPGMKRIPAGRFVMGSTHSSDELPLTEVEIQEFNLDSTEITQADFQALVGYNPSRFQNPSHPVERLNWFDAVRYCNARSKAANLDTAYTYDSLCSTCMYWNYTTDTLHSKGFGWKLVNVQRVLGANGYHLPSEEQWEYAARAGTSTDFFWGRNYGSFLDGSAYESEINSYAAWRGNSFDLGGPDPLQQSRVPALPDPDPTVKVVRCSTAAQLMSLFYRGMREPLTILLKDGEYDLSYWIFGSNGLGSQILIDKPKTSIIGESRDPRKVIIKGKGFHSDDAGEELIRVAVDDVTLAYFTLKEVRANGIKIQSALSRLVVHNIHFEDIGERCIKAPQGPLDAPITSTDVKVRYCTFSQYTAYTKDRPNHDRQGLDYIAGIDAMFTRNWHVHDNVFKNIRGGNGEGRGGVFFWVNSTGLLLERNTFHGCDRSIAMGNPSGSLMDYHVSNSLIRNNLVVNTRWYAVEICSTSNIRFYHNTIVADNPNQYAIHAWKNLAGNLFRNNVIVGAVRATGTGGVFPDTVGNFWGVNALSVPKTWFVDAGAGNYRLSEAASPLIDKGSQLAEVLTDFEHQTRDASPDFGMDELGTAPNGIQNGKIKPKQLELVGWGTYGQAGMAFNLRGPIEDFVLLIYSPSGKKLWEHSGKMNNDGAYTAIWPLGSPQKLGAGKFLAVLSHGNGHVSSFAFSIRP